MNTIFPRLVRLIALCSMIALITACGNKGPLVPPKAGAHASAAFSALAALA